VLGEHREQALAEHLLVADDPHPGRLHWHVHMVSVGRRRRPIWRYARKGESGGLATRELR